MYLRSLADVEILDATQPLGNGAFSKVLKCRLKKTGRVFALKVIDMERLSQADCDNLRYEIEFNERLAHPNVIKYFDCMQIDEVVYILLELAPRGSLFSYINAETGLSEALALRFFVQAASAIRHLGEHGVLHRDVKPENLLLTDGFALKLCDLGWACAADAPEEQRSGVCGTYQYMAPEVCRRQPQTAKVDVWALGVLLYEMLAGRAPYRGSSTAAVLQDIEGGLPAFPAKLGEQARELIARMLEVDPEKRCSVQEALRHPLAVEALRALARPLSPEQSEELSAALEQRATGRGLKLIREAEQLIARSAPEEPKARVLAAPKAKLPENVKMGKKVIRIGDPLERTVKVQQNYVYSADSREDGGPAPAAEAKVAWRTVSTLDIGSAAAPVASSSAAGRG